VALSASPSRNAGPAGPPEGGGTSGLDRPQSASPASIALASGPTSGSESDTARRWAGSHLDSDANCRGHGGGVPESELDAAGDPDPASRGGGPQSRQGLGMWTGRVALVPTAAPAEASEAEPAGGDSHASTPARPVPGHGLTRSTVAPAGAVGSLLERAIVQK
jgi:hypothetical protein